MAEAARPLRFLFDFVSPYAFVAWKRVGALARAAERELELVPVLFAGLLDAHGALGPAEVPAKRQYVFKDAWRKAHAAGLELVPPPSHPFNPLLALRVAGLDLEEGARARVVDCLFDAAWGGLGGLEGPEDVARAVTRAGVDGAELVRRAGEPQAKARLRAATEQAVREGVFGVPSIFADGELFWGVDSLEHVERRLRGDDPLPADLVARWAHLPSSAVRPR